MKRTAIASCALVFGLMPGLASAATQKQSHAIGAPPNVVASSALSIAPATVDLDLPMPTLAQELQENAPGATAAGDPDFSFIEATFQVRQTDVAFDSALSDEGGPILTQNPLGNTF